MNRTLPALLIITMLIFTGCGDADEDTTTNAPDSVEAVNSLEELAGQPIENEEDLMALAESLAEQQFEGMSSEEIDTFLTELDSLESELEGVVGEMDSLDPDEVTVEDLEEILAQVDTGELEKTLQGTDGQ